MTDLPSFSISQLIESGVHFGHKTMRWNPKMAPYIYGVRDDIHIIDLQKTSILLRRALHEVYEVVKNNGRVLFVGTKKQASELVAESAKRCGQYFVNHRWLGGMLTNWETVSLSIKTLCDLEQKLEVGSFAKFTKKELLEITRKCQKLDMSLGGIKNMGGKPDLLFVIDTNKEHLAVKEAIKLGIPIIAIVDSNSDPDGIDFPIPGNDDATRAIRLYCQLFSDAALAGIQASLAASGADIGAAAEVPLGAQDESATAEKKATKTKKTVAKKPRVSKVAVATKASRGTKKSASQEEAATE